MKERDSQRYVLLTSLGEPLEASYVRELLEASGIKVQERSNISGPYMNQMDGPIAEYHIYVDERDLVAARRLLDRFQADYARDTKGSIP
jgi:Putative prokaryotic signal transducing protein